MTAEERYSDELRELARRLAIAAGTARSRRLWGLEDALTAARESAASWSESMEKPEEVACS